MPTRYLKESICTSDNIDQLSAFQETFFYRLIVNCDDYGRMDARPKILASKLFPLKTIRVEQIMDALRALTSAELVTLYSVGGKPFVQMNTWDKHQTCRAKVSKYPGPEDADNCMQMNTDADNCMQMNTDSSVIVIDNRNRNRNRNRESESQSTRARAFIPPTVEEVREYIQEKGYTIDPEEFVAYYEQSGWYLKKNQKMTDWKASVRYWMTKRNQKKAQEAAPVSKWGQIGQMV